MQYLSTLARFAPLVTTYWSTSVPSLKIVLAQGWLFKQDYNRKAWSTMVEATK